MTLSHSFEITQRKRRLPFAKKKKRVSLGPFLHRKMSLISPALAAFFISPCSPLVHKRKRKGDSGSPYCIPLDG